MIMDIGAQARNTAIIRAAAQTVLENQPRPARQLATMVPTKDDKIKLRRMTIGGAGLAPLKAIGATSPIFAAKMRYSEEFIELVQIAEHSPIDERVRRNLLSDDPEIADRAGIDLTELARIMFLRNENRSDLMVMTAILTGQLQIVFEDEPSQGFKIVYDYLSTHMVNGSDWTNPTTATPIVDLEATQLLLGNDAGEYGINFWMNAQTAHNLVWSDEAKGLLTGFDGRGQYIPTYSDIGRRLREPDRIQWHVTDSGYRNEGEFLRGRSVLNQWIPNNVVIMTTSDPFEGEPLCEMFDGLVQVRTAFDQLTLRQGQQSFAKIDDSDTWQWHQVSTRIPRINRPECIAVIDVGP